VVRTHGLGAKGQAPVDGVASLGIRPTVEDAGRVLLEVHCLDWTPEGAGLDSAYGKIIRVELLHKLHDELKYEGLEALQKGISRDCDNARAFFAAMHTETSLDRI
jgi:riboflavin kinase/FMN adenylyltransferase